MNNESLLFGYERWNLAHRRAPIGREAENRGRRPACVKSLFMSHALDRSGCSEAALARSFQEETPRPFDNGSARVSAVRWSLVFLGFFAAVALRRRPATIAFSAVSLIFRLIRGYRSRAEVLPSR